MKKIIPILCVILLCSFSLFGCGNSDDTSLKEGQSLTLSKDAPVATSKDGVDKIINYEKENNEKGLEDMEANGEAKTLSSGTKVNVIKVGIIVEVETDDGTDYYAPKEIFK